MIFEATQALGLEIAGSGTALPEDLKETHDVVGEVDDEQVYSRLLGAQFSEELESRSWSRERVASWGVETRQWCVEPGRSRQAASADAYDLALAAGERALRDAGIEAETLDVLIVTSSTPPRISGSIAHRIARAWGIDASAFDLKAGGAGAVHAWMSAVGMMQIGGQRALVIAAETPSYYVHPQDLTSALLFGDGAGALLLQQSPSLEDGGLLCGFLGSAQAPGKPFTIPGNLPPSLNEVEGSQFTFQREDEPYRQGLRELWSQSSARLRESSAATNFFLPYAVTRSQVEAAAQELGGDEMLAATHDTLESHGCLGCAGPLVSLDVLRKGDGLRDGDVITTSAVAGGNAWGGLHWKVRGRA